MLPIRKHIVSTGFRYTGQRWHRLPLEDSHPDSLEERLSCAGSISRNSHVHGEGFPDIYDWNIQFSFKVSNEGS